MFVDADCASAAAAPHAFVYLAAERPDKMVPEAQLEGLQAIEASILNEAQLQRQLEAQAAQLLAGGFISPTLRPISQLPQVRVLLLATFPRFMVCIRRT